MKHTVKVYINKSNGTLEVFNAFAVKDQLKNLGARFDNAHITAREPKAWILPAKVENLAAIKEFANVEPYQF